MRCPFFQNIFIGWGELADCLNRRKEAKRGIFKVAKPLAKMIYRREKFSFETRSTRRACIEERWVVLHSCPLKHVAKTFIKTPVVRVLKEQPF